MISAHQLLPDAPPSVKALFAHLLLKGPASRVEIAREAGLARPTVSDAAERLLDYSLIKVLDKDAGATGKRGRIPELYDLADGIGTLLTFTDQGEKIEATACDLRCNVLQRESLDLNWNDQTSVQEAITTLIKKLEPAHEGTILASALSLTLPVNPGTQQITHLDSGEKHQETIDLYRILREETGAPVIIDNHANWGLYSEYSKGSSHRYSAVVSFTFDKDLGCALGTGGHIERGAKGRAGELSRILIGGRRFKDIINDVAVHSPIVGLSGFTYVDIEATAQKIIHQQDDPTVVAFLDALGNIAANLLMLLDAEALLLFGPMTDIPGFTDRISEVVQEKLAWDVQIESVEDGAGVVQRGTALGAQQLALQALGLGEFK